MARAQATGLEGPIAAYADTCHRIMEPLQEGLHFLCLGSTALPDVKFEGKTYKSFRKSELREAMQTMTADIRPSKKKMISTQVISEAILDLLDWDDMKRQKAEKNQGDHVVSII